MSLPEENNSRIIFHIDVNSAFLSWSAVKRLKEDPSATDLRTVPSAVGGDVATRHGVITARSIPAKRMGVKTGEAVMTALKKCPDLILIPSDFETYRSYSRAFIAILKKYTPVVQQASIDEAYLDVTEVWETYKRNHTAKLQEEKEEQEEQARRAFSLALAAAIRKEIRETLSFTVNVGISANKLLAKMASDFEKPDKTHTLYPEEIEGKMWPLPIGDLYGCGGKTAQKLRTLGVLTIGDAAVMPMELLQSYLGEKAGEYIYTSANGQSSDIVSEETGDAKSYSNELTTSFDITAANYEAEMPPLIEFLSGKVAGRLQRDNVYARTVGVMVKTNDFHRRSMQMKLDDPVNDADTIRRVSSELMKKLLLSENGLLKEADSGIRLVGVSTSDLDHGAYRQLTLAEIMAAEQTSDSKQNPDAVKPPDKGMSDEKRDRLNEMLRGINAKFGEGTLKKGL